jgi:hypothetical protein
MFLLEGYIRITILLRIRNSDTAFPQFLPLWPRYLHAVLCIRELTLRSDSRENLILLFCSRHGF